MQAEKTQAAIYCRVAHADEFALENQRRTLYDFAAAQGYDDCVEYSDNGESGLTLDRPAFTRLHNDILAGKIKVVFVVSISRIGRDIYTTFKWLDEIQALGVKVISRNGDIESSVELSSLLRKIVK